MRMAPPRFHRALGETVDRLAHGTPHIFLAAGDPLPERLFLKLMPARALDGHMLVNLDPVLPQTLLDEGDELSPALRRVASSK
jgi:hypothetical protein